MYVLVLLASRPGLAAEPPEHEPFVDSLVQRELVLMGGPVEPGGGAAYVLRCGSVAEARDVVAGDPLVSSGAMVPTLLEWDLVGVDLRLVDPALVVGDGPS